MHLLLALVLLGTADDLVARLASDDSNEVIAACRDAASSEEPALTAPLLRLLKHENPAVRKAAIETLAVRKPAEEKKKAAQALAARIAPLADKKEDKEECIAVANALHDLAQPVALKPLLDGIKLDSDRDVARARMHAAANVPTKEAIDELLQLGLAGHRGQWRTVAVVEALRYATQAKVEGGMEAWRRWWNDNRDTYDADIVANKRADARIAEQDRKKKGKKGGEGE